MTILSMAQRASRSIGIPVPSTVIGNTDRQVVQLLEIANEEGQDLADRHRWSQLILENTFTQAAARDQGALNSTVVSTGDFDYILPDTMWNRTTQLPVLGALSPLDWQTLQAFPVTGPYQQYKIEGKNLYFDPVPSNATDTIAFHYKSTFWCENTGATGATTWQNDTDTGRLDEDLMRLGMIWRWKKTKGLEYAEDFNTYERRVLNAMARDRGPSRIALNGGIRHRLPGIMVPHGTWNL